MKYQDIINAKREFSKCDSEYLWAMSTLNYIKNDMRIKNINFNSKCPTSVVNSLISKLCKSYHNKENLRNVFDVATAYLECEKSITDFEKTGNSALIQEVGKKQSEFKYKITEYSKKTKKSITSPLDILHEILYCIEAYGDEMKTARGQIMQKIKSNLHSFKFADTLELNSETLRYSRPTLPRNICIGQHVAGKDSFSKMLFSNNENPYVVLNLTYKGNIYISDFDNDARATDRFITAYIFSCLNRFPLGALNIHIIDKTPNLTVITENKLGGKFSKKILTIHKDFSVLDNLNNVICRDISKKIGSACRNVYDLYDRDKTECVNLVIIRAPFGKNSEYEVGNALEKVKVLSGDYGHNCGVRFLIIDTAKKSDLNSRENISEIQKHCGIVATKEDGRYFVSGLRFNPIYFTGDELAFIESQSNRIVELLAKKHKPSIAYEDIVNIREQTILNDAIMRIPVGKSSNKVIELPFSCKNVDGSAEGMCVSYMVIGATGSGKSSLFDSVVMCGSMKYSPKELQFWLLDFKDGIATEKYKKSQLPHIAVVADKNSPSDAISLFAMIQTEMTSRKEQFNRYSGCSDIYAFNQYAEKHKEPNMPRIIILIDEIQELMNCEYQYEIIRELISVSNRIRAFGIHLIMIAQNLSDGRNNHLQEVLSQANGRICFRIDNEETLRNSSMGASFTERYNEIKNLGQGEVYLKYGNMDEPQRVQIAYTSPTLFGSKYFPSIRAKYNITAKTRIVGASEKLMIDAYSSYLQSKYYNSFDEIKRTRKLDTVIGENAYTHEPLGFTLSEKENSSICFIGSNKEISNSLMVSTLASLIEKNATIYVFNGDTSSIIKDFLNQTNDENVFYRTRGELIVAVSSIYAQFLERRQMEDDEKELYYEPIVLCINDATGIRAIREDTAIDEFLDEGGYSAKTVTKILNELATEGYRYKIFVVLAITEDTFNENMISNISKMVFFHNTAYTHSSVNSMLYADLMQSMNEEGKESSALYLSNKVFTKFRPFQYDWKNHKKILTNMAKGMRK